MTAEITVYSLTLEDLRQVAEGLNQRLRFRDVLFWLVTGDDLLEMLTETVQEVKAGQIQRSTEVTP